MEKTTQECLQIIADRLWGGHASLFVGAGFSKNATLLPDGILPPNWDELGCLFYEKSQGRKPTRRDLVFSSVLRLAEDVENVCGRPELTALINDAINNDKLRPSDIHIQLLALPWQDVYTTNYDTLLERTVDHLKEQGKRTYSLVTDSRTIGMVSSPLLMKLHGDINDPSSIVVTEEDYRTYPVNHQAMINHIQHTIMTKTLVLVGFSGNDPNFHQWLGWVKDALNNNQRKLYLLSVNPVTDVARKSFEKKNVVVVSLQDLARKGASPSEIISAAVRYLEDYPIEREKEQERYRRFALEWGRKSSIDEDLETTFKRWKQERDTYPGWLVMPREKRELWASIDGFTLSRDKLSELRGDKDILFLDLFNWRIERSLFPITNDWEDIYLSVLEKYQPFSHRSKSGIKTAWMNLKLGLLRLYRQEGWQEKWTLLKEELFGLIDRMSEEQRCRFSYEQALEAVYQNDFKLLESILNNWDEALEDPYWDVRRGAIWSEYLSFEIGKEITKKAFQKISKKLEASGDESARYFWGSRKVHAHAVWNSMAQANLSDGHEETASARKTWTDLRSYDDIWYEREFFESHMRPIEDALKVKTKTASFKLGYVRTSTNLSGNAKDYRIAYAYFLYYEETGFPIHLPFLISVDKQTLEKALSVMAYCSPSIAETWLLRSGDSNLVQAVYNRRFLERTKQTDVDKLYKRYLDCLYRSVNLPEGDSIPSWILVYRSILPEILSRLCMKASYGLRIKTLDYIEAVFRDGVSRRFTGLDRLLSSIVTSFSKEETVGLIPRLALMPIANDGYGDCQYEALCYAQKPGRILTSVSTMVDSLLNQMGLDEKKDKAILYRLMYLSRCSEFSKEHNDRLAELLWSRRDKSGFPDRTYYSRFTFLSFPHPKEIDPELLLKDYFYKQDIPSIGDGGRVTFGGLSILNDLKGTINDDISFNWDSPLLNKVCERLILMWDRDKGRLQKDEYNLMGYSIKDEVQDRLDDVGRVIVGVMAPHIHLLDERNRSGLARLSREYESYDMPAFRMKLAISELLEEPLDVDREISIRLAMPDERIIDDCINTIIQLYKRGDDIHSYLELMSEYFRSNAHQGQKAIIRGIKFFIEKGYCITELVHENLMIGLNRLFQDTIVLGTDDELEANDKMFFRMAVAPIVARLSLESVNDKRLSPWLDYYSSEDTCWDIRNTFSDSLKS